MLPNIKIAIIHDWLTGMRGGEKVLEAFCELCPQADIFTLIHNRGSVSEIIESHQIFTSIIDNFPFKSKNYRNYLPFFPTAIEKFNLREYDLILSTSHCVAKGVITPPTSLHISYLHTPMRYVWDMYDEYFGKEHTGWLSRKVIPFFANYLRIWDVTSSNRCDWFIANSSHVSKRIKKYYGRDATVVHPPVDISNFSIAEGRGEDYLIVSALVPYKKVDLAIRVFNQLNKRLVIVGDGPDKDKLRRLANKNVEFVNWQPNQKLKEYCRALIFPGEEDFGIVPLEAMACGKPVIAFGKGGALESVVGFKQGLDDKSTGIFFNIQTESALLEALNQCETVSWNPKFIWNHAQKFSSENFKLKISDFIAEKFEIFSSLFSQD
jgi:glycosyltransferase involved in cell wall biosynthesis